jgi:hypothetical protein
MQESLDYIASWSSEWQLPISFDKCSVIVLGRSCARFPFHLNGTILKYNDNLKDLGVIIDSSLKFNLHVNYIVNKAHSRASLILKCFVSRNRNSMVRAFKVYCRPLLEYASSVWSPHFSQAIDKIESVQRRFTKRLRGLAETDYAARLSLLDLPSLEQRRLMLDLTLTYKVTFGLIDVTFNYFSLRQTASMSTRGNPYKLNCVHGRTDVRQHYFCNRVCNIWNSLPPSIVDFTSISSFRRTQRNVNLHIFTKF